MTAKLYLVDAFTAAPFAGNPAGVCVLEAPVADTWMQRVAAEVNQAETAFLWPLADGFGLRWFTPQVEVDLCGHATLASAHVLWESGTLAADAVARFSTRSGELTAVRREGRIELDFPVDNVGAPLDKAVLERALGVPPLEVRRGRFDLLALLADEGAVRQVRPDLPALAGLEARGVCVTARSTDPACDFVSRFFAPGVGIPEDPVTGSAHCMLGPFWGARLGKTELVGRQLSARGGVVQVRVAGDRVQLGGQAVTVLVGRLLATP